MKLEKGNKGITLISLVITIIILLILAGISIAQLTGNGLFKNAKLAKEKSENAQQKENTTLGEYENLINQEIDGTRDNNYQYQKLRSNNYEEVPFVNGQKYIAPCDGYYCLAISSDGATTQWQGLVAHYLADDTLISTTTSTGYNWGRSGCELYMNRGEYIIITKQDEVNVQSSKFFYAVGCEPDNNE